MTRLGRIITGCVVWYCVVCCGVLLCGMVLCGVLLYGDVVCCIVWCVVVYVPIEEGVSVIVINVDEPPVPPVPPLVVAAAVEIAGGRPPLATTRGLRKRAPGGGWGCEIEGVREREGYEIGTF